VFTPEYWSFQWGTGFTSRDYGFKGLKGNGLIKYRITDKCTEKKFHNRVQQG